MGGRLAVVDDDLAVQSVQGVEHRGDGGARIDEARLARTGGDQKHLERQRQTVPSRRPRALELTPDRHTAEGQGPLAVAHHLPGLDVDVRLDAAHRQAGGTSVAGGVHEAHVDTGAFRVLEEGVMELASPVVDLPLDLGGADPVARADELDVVLQVPAQVCPGVLAQGEGQRAGLGLLALRLDEARGVGVAPTMDDETEQVGIEEGGVMGHGS